MLSFEISFTQAQLDKLVRSAVLLWGGSYSNIVSVAVNSTDDPARFRGTVNYKDPGGKQVSLTLSHEVLVEAVSLASANEGNPIDPASLTFQYNPGRGFGGGSSVSAKAMTSSEPSSKAEKTPGKLTFPGIIERRFAEDEVKELLKSAARRQGGKANSASFNAQGEPKAEITIEISAGKTGTVTWKGDILTAQLTAELTASGYVVAPDGISYNYTPGAGFGGPPRHGINVQLSAIPLV